MKSIEIRGDNYVGSYQRINLACRAIVVKDDMVLLSYEKNTNQFMIPGGGLEIGESEECCVKREVEEETGFLLDVDECVLEIHEYSGTNDISANTSWVGSSEMERSILPPGRSKWAWNQDGSNAKRRFASSLATNHSATSTKCEGGSIFANIPL